MLLGRLFSYPDTHRHRIGPNYLQLPVNAPKTPVNSYNRDGAMRFDTPADPVYAPNSFGGPVARPEFETPHWQVEAGEIVREAYALHSEDADFGQPGTLVRDVFDDAHRERFVANVTGHLGAVDNADILDRALDYWRNVDANIGAQIAKNFGK